ncbi:MAG: hypothetical protein E7302_08010 [Butyrivibrio sp.]|nr:hypothetical protein [Butyrivibrio sp.]
MAIVSYEGELGKFEYDNDEFKLQDGLLIYVGHEQDGAEIHMPKGKIYSCSQMFAGSAIVTPPEIPDMVCDLSYMFFGCESLKEPAIIPLSAECIDSMYEKCSNLRLAPVIPQGVESCLNVFAGCPRDTEFAGNYNILHRGQAYTDEAAMKRYTGRLGTFLYNPKEFEIKLSSAGLEYLAYIGMETDGDKIKIPEGLIIARNMFKGRDDLISAPVVPKGVSDVTSMFLGCSEQVQQYGAENINERGIQHSFIKIDGLGKNNLRMNPEENIIKVLVPVPEEDYENGKVIVLPRRDDLVFKNGIFSGLRFWPMSPMREAVVKIDGRKRKIQLDMKELEKSHRKILDAAKKSIDETIQKGNKIELLREIRDW